MYRLLRRIVTKSSLPHDKDWDTNHCFDFGGKSFLAVLEFMRKRHFQTGALHVVKTIVDVEERSMNESGAQVMTTVLVNESLLPYLESARKSLKFVYDGLLSHKLWKSDLVKVLARFDYCVLFGLPK